MPNEKLTAFPICQKFTSFQDAKERRLAGVPDDAIRLIEALQPYPERNPGGVRVRKLSTYWMS